MPAEGRAMGSPAGSGPIAPLPAALCSGAVTPSAFAGSLSVEGGGSPPPNIIGVTVTLSYWADLNFTPKNGSSIFSCVPESSVVSTSAIGAVRISAPLPTSGCNKFSCSTYSGPFGPLVFATPNSTPAGYFLTQSLSGNQVGLAWVYALSTSRLVPTSRVTLSADAPTVVRAFPTAGNGGPSPASVGFDWQLVGNGWSLLNGSGTSNVTIEAFDGASPGTLTVWSNGTYNGTAVAAPAVTLDLAASSTTASGGGVDPTSLDVGFPALFTVTGGGAGGYAYHADLLPGLGMGEVIAPCTTSIVAGGLVALTCTASVAYDRPGIAQPSANLTNGYSTASWPFSPITVAPTLGFSIAPQATVAYVGAAGTVTVTADPASGTAPRGPACLFPGNGRVLCDPGPGPSYSFSVTYGLPGKYTGKATLADASGANESIPFSATVYDRPALSPLLASTNTLAAGQTTAIVGSISGGALPFTYWWNSSQPSGTLYEGTAPSDGPVLLNFTPHVSGPTTIFLTVVDSLGTSVFQPISMNVTAGPATGLSASLGTNRAIVAGAATPISWSAVNPVGEVVATWSGTVSLAVSPGAGAYAGRAGGPPLAWVNLSGSPVAPGADGSFPIPAGAWSSGILRVTVAFGGAGTFYLTVSGGLPLVGGGANGTGVVVGPDTGHLVLSHPTVAQAGVRTNRTLWQITDEFGDLLDGGAIRVETTVGTSTAVVSSPIFNDAGAGSAVWVNYSVPDGVAATIYVLSDSGQSLLPAISVPAPSAGAVVPVAWLLVAVGAALAAASAYGLWSRSRRRSSPEPAPSSGGPTTEDELRRWAEGRAHVLQRTSTERGQTLDELAQGFVGRPPPPDEMTDWVASLVADGSLRTVLGDDGRSRFLKVRGDDSGPPRVQLDDRALAEALDRRAAIDGPDEERDPP
ncbi:MAG: hypothetical protein L3K06_03085 [Thermoplasmata archaeon]|nr:hypothetical protein [Thermoplasmata archaeon]